MEIAMPPNLAVRLDVMSLDSTSQQILLEIQRTLGFIPPFFIAAESNPQVLQNLWQQTVSAYLSNPLPSVFKEKLSAYLSRFCVVPYCMICHSCSLHELGLQAQEVLALLEAPPPTEADIDIHLSMLAQQVDALQNLDQNLATIAPELEASLLVCAISLALKTDPNNPCRTELRRLLGHTTYQHLVTFLAYIQTCHTWMAANPEVSYQADRRVQLHFQTMLEQEPDLAEFFQHYRERVQHELQAWHIQQAEIAERQRNEAVLRKMAEENLCLAQAIASTSEGVLVTNPNLPDNPIIYCNAAFSRITGYSSDQVLGQNCRFLQGAETDRQAVAQIRQAIAERREIKTTLLNYRKDGQPFWNEVKIAPVFSDQGNLLYFVGIQADISDRKRAEASLKQSELALRSFFNSTSMMMGIVELQGNDILHLSDNPTSAQFLGKTPAQMQNRLASDLGIPDEHVQQWIQYYREAEDSQRPVHFEYSHPTTQGRVWLSATVSAIPGNSSQPTRFAYVVEDITDRKQTEEKLREQAALLDVTTDAIWVWNLEYQIVFWNKGAEKLCGWQMAEVLGSNAIEQLHLENLSHLHEARKTVLNQGEWQGELQFTTKAGKVLTVASRWTLVCNADRQPTSILLVNTDITEKKQLESQFLRAQRMESIGTLASGIAHDLNNVLTPILASAQLLLMQIPQQDAKRQQLLETIQASARRGASLIKQVLSFARGMEGKRTALQARHLISEVGQIMQETFPKSIELHLDLANDLWLVSGDATQLHQVLMNLCVNARDAMPEGGTLSVSAANFWIDEHYARMNLDAHLGPYIVITVADTGTGIAPDALDRIFEPFFTTKEMGKGTGLGLSTALGIVKSHGGFVEVNSAPKVGTQFKIYLPAIQSEEFSQPSEEELAIGQGELILVVEDEAAIREINQAALEAYNYRVLTANDGIEAITLYVEHKHEISLALIDLMMPSMDGTMAIRALKRINPQLKVVAVSGLIAGTQLPESTNTDIHLFLPKPYTAKDLVKSVHQTLHA